MTCFPTSKSHNKICIFFSNYKHVLLITNDSGLIVLRNFKAIASYAATMQHVTCRNKVNSMYFLYSSITDKIAVQFAIK